MGPSRARGGSCGSLGALLKLLGALWAALEWLLAALGVLLAAFGRFWSLPGVPWRAIGPLWESWALLGLLVALAWEGAFGPGKWYQGSRPFSLFARSRGPCVLIGRLVLGPFGLAPLASRSPPLKSTVLYLFKQIAVAAEAPW